MPGWLNGEVLFYVGIVLISAAVIGGVISAILLRRSKRKLNQQLDAEFGRKL